MSADEQTQNVALSDFANNTPEDTQSADAASWQPQDERECRNCGSKVTDQYRRVAGDNQDIVHECPQCPDEDTNNSRRMHGAAAGLDVEDRKMTTKVSYQ